jgi:hypothetical protein
VASFDDLFGKKSDDSGVQRMRFDEAGEAFLLVQTGEPKHVSQKNKDGEVIHIVKMESWPKGKPLPVSEYDPEDADLEWVVKPKDIVIPVKVLAKKDRAGKKIEDFEPFDTDWKLGRDEREKFKDAMLDAGVEVTEGTKYARKLLTKPAKGPYTYSIKILTD